ncbi:DnaD domain-containing protein [Desulfosporosinus meridiei]|uniref:DnaD-like protein n=1 Tax=Desulfosporosinus meridiei (strain ATCC BAA-275 / DSM 13257 / KCTC 12902 / NCIMB 13706 / S10) TaxID=768704 RepID=J7J5U0_DESMD|nr:DnaD domain protein [Desulfosporosinus meridiei]AFQ46281.1 DnaD-like protein [Desulfosporosinus meridiei DSM 13257]
MARARNIKPSFFANDQLGELPPLARLLFIGLWGLADRKGKLEDRPKRIKAEVLPYDDCNVDELLNLLDPEFIVRYTVDGISCIQIVNFSKHQKPHPKEGESDLPNMPENGQAVNRYERAVKINGKDEPKNLKVFTSREKVMTSPAESLLLNVESPILNVDCCFPHNEAENDDNNGSKEIRQSVNEPEETVSETPKNVNNLSEIVSLAIGTRAVNWAEKNWGRLIPKGETDMIMAYCDEFFTRGSPDPDAVVIEALKCCLDANARNMHYLRGVLKDWRESGILTVDQVHAREAERNRQKDYKRNRDPGDKTPEPPKPGKYDAFYL